MIEHPTAADSQPIPALSNGDHNLPAALNSFVGRDADRATVAEELRMSRLVTLVGAAGVDKTRLALEVAALLVPDHPDGVWLVELSSVTDGALIAQALTSVLGIPEQPGVGAFDTLVAGLRERRCLVVLDNCEHLLEGCAYLAEQLLRSCGQLVILATSREPLRLNGESIHRIPPLAVPPADWEPGETLAGCDSVQLFVERGASARAGFELTAEVAPAVAEICRALDGLPLAIELAAARLELLSPAEIVEHLGDRVHVLGGRRTAAPGHHATLEAALDWSYELLSEQAAALLGRLSVFVGGCSLEAVEATCSFGTDLRGGTIPTLAALVGKSWVVADTGAAATRYRLLGTVRDYAGHKLEGSGERDAVRRAYCAWAVELAEQAEEQLGRDTNREWLERLVDEQDNLRAALQWALDDGMSESALRLGAALALFWWLRGQADEGREWLDRALSGGSNEPAWLRAKALWGAGLLASAAGEAGVATRLSEESIGLSADCDGQTVAGRSRNLSGLLALYRGAPRALPLLERNVELARSEDDTLILGSALANLGSAHLLLSDARSARLCLEECLELTEQSHRSLYEGVLNGLAQAALLEGDYATATKLFEQARDLARTLNEAEPVAAALSWLGELARRRGCYDQARALLSEGLDTAREHGAPFSVARCLCFLGLLADDESEPVQARTYLNQSLAMARAGGLTYIEVRCLTGIARVSIGEGDLVAARALFDEASLVAGENGDRHALAAVLYALADLGRVRGPIEEARSLCHAALQLQGEIGDLAGIASSLELVAVLRGPDAGSVRLLGAASALRERGAYATPPTSIDMRESHLKVTRQALGRDGCAAAWAEGTALSVDKAVAYASRMRGARHRPDAGWASLTPTQFDVAQLAARGLTNREIGERLFVSPRTAGAHLSRVFAKLGISSRRELASLADGRAEAPSVQSRT